MAELDTLRMEIRQDNAEMRKLITERFDRIDDKFDAQIEELQVKQATTAERVGTVESRMNTFGKGLWALVLTVFGSALAFLFSFFKPHG